MRARRSKGTPERRCSGSKGSKVSTLLFLPVTGRVDSYGLATVLRDVGPTAAEGGLMGRDFQRIGIVNRGEPAVRLIHAVREYNRESGAAVRAIAFHTRAERRALFVREADETVCFEDLRPSSDATRS